MATTVTIDKAGRIVVPKEMRDQLHLAPGTPLRVERSGDGLTLVPATPEARLVIENGTPLIIPAEASGNRVLTTEMVNELMAEQRAERHRRLCGPSRDDDTA
jgi:AbrB family looped-hinge helix DNA binding protein